MHEFVLTQSIIDEVITSLQDHQNTHLISVNLGFGPFTHATFDRIEFWWNTLIVGTSLEDGKIIKTPLDGKLFCPSCDQEFIIKDRDQFQFDEYLDIFSCPQCNSYQTKILEGTDIIILNIEIIESKSLKVTSE